MREREISISQFLCVRVCPFMSVAEEVKLF